MPLMRATARVLMLLASLWMVSTLAIAATPCVVAAQSADELLEQGIAQRRAGDDTAALATFQRAYDATPSARAAAQLGLVHQALGQWVEAHTRLNEALAMTSDEWVTRNRAALTQALAVVDGEVGTVEILISGSLPRGTRATLGAREITTFPMSRPITVVAGEEALEVTAPGHRTVRRDVRVRAGQLSRVTVELRAESVETSTGTETGSSAASTGTGTESGSSAETGSGSSAGTETGAGTGSTGTPTDGGSASNDDWIVWVIIGAVVVVGAGVAIGVVASQQSLEAPLPGTAGAVELLRF